MSRLTWIVVCLASAGLAWPGFPEQQAQTPPALVRSFAAGTVSAYRVQLTVRSEVEGQRPIRIGEKAYAEQFSRFAEARITWDTTRRILAVGTDRYAEVEESLDRFAPVEVETSRDDDEAKKLGEALRATLTAWGVARTLRYRETPSGQLLDVKAEGAPGLDDQPPLVTLWLLRALRPAVTLPARPVRFDEPWQEARSVALEPWQDARGSERGEWLPVYPEAAGRRAPGSFEPAAKLHIVQQIIGAIPSSQASFHAESLTTVSLGDGRVLAGTRSATRETSRTLVLSPAGRDEGIQPPAGAPASNSADTPRFRGRISVQVQIEEVP